MSNSAIPFLDETQRNNETSLRVLMMASGTTKIPLKALVKCIVALRELNRQLLERVLCILLGTGSL